MTGTAVPRAPVGGLIEASVGVGGAITVKATELLTPPGAVTVTFLAVAAAPAVKVKLALTWLSLTTVMPLTVTPPPGTVTAVVPVNPVPKILTAIAPSPRRPADGEIELSTGPSTVYVCGLLVPAGLVTVMLRGPIAAPTVVLKVALICVGLTKVTPVMVRPLAGASTCTVDPAVKLLPVSTTATGLAVAAVRRRP